MLCGISRYIGLNDVCNQLLRKMCSIIHVLESKYMKKYVILSQGFARKAPNLKKNWSGYFRHLTSVSVVTLNINGASDLGQSNPVLVSVYFTMTIKRQIYITNIPFSMYQDIGTVTQQFIYTNLPHSQPHTYHSLSRIWHRGNIKWIMYAVNIQPFEWIWRRHHGNRLQPHLKICIYDGIHDTDCVREC